MLRARQPDGQRLPPPECAESKTIQLTKGKAAVVDASDYSRLSCSEWHALRPTASGTYYAANSDREYLHRVIMRAGPDDIVDHRNGDGLDCRKANLRICSRKQNVRNRRVVLSSSGFKGVSYDNTRRKWAAKITANYKTINLGRFATAEDAAAAYDRAAAKLFGEFACLNFKQPAEATNGAKSIKA